MKWPQLNRQILWYRLCHPNYHSSSIITFNTLADFSGRSKSVSAFEIRSLIPHQLRYQSVTCYSTPQLHNQYYNSITIILIAQCRGMMTENYLSSNTAFPITHGTAITVKCDPQFSLMGSQVITCDEGIVYSHQYRRPKCVSPGEWTSWHFRAIKFNSKMFYICHSIYWIHF